MKKLFIAILSVLMVLTGAFSFCKTSADEQIYHLLDFDRRLIIRIGDQRASGPCTVYSLAYARLSSRMSSLWPL